MFKPIQFVYNPPKTIPPAPDEMRSPDAAAAAVPATSRVKDLTDQLELLEATSNYLQEAILAVNSDVVVPVVPEQKPEVAQALHRIYGKTPAGISAAMYNNLLDTQMAAIRAEVQMKNVDTGLKINPVQKADLQMLIQEYESQVVESGQFDPNTTLLLNQLKGDNVIFEQLQEGLNEYESELDVSEDIHNEIKQRLDGWQTYYSVTYSLARDIDSVYGDLVEITEKYFYQPIDILLKLTALISSLRSLLHKPNLQDLRASIVWLVYPRLISEVGKYTFLLDRLVQKAVDPVFEVLGSADRLFAQICAVAADAAYLIGKGNFSGLRQEMGYQWNNPGRSPSPKDRERIKELDKLSKGMASVQGHIAKAIQQARSKRQRVLRSMTKLMDRRLVGTADRLELLESLRSVQAIVGILQSMAMEVQRMAPSSRAGQIMDAPLGPVGQAIGEIQGTDGSIAGILAGIEQGANLSITLHGDSVQVKRNVQVPNPPPDVAQALADHLPEKASNG